MNSSLLFMTCSPRLVKQLVDEVTTLLEAEQSPTRVVKYGVLCKGQDGFLILAIAHPDGFSAKFFEHIRHEEDITGYVTLTSDICVDGKMEGPHDHDD